MKKRRWAVGYCALVIVALVGGSVYAYIRLQTLIAGPPLGDQPAYPLHRVWSQTLDHEILDLTADDRGDVILGKTSSSLCEIQAVDGKLFWCAPIGSQISSFPAIIAGERAFVTDRDALWAFDLKTGATLWRQVLKSSSTWVTAASKDLVLVNSVSDNITAYEADSGRLLWSLPAGRGYIRAYASGDAVYIVDDAIQALDSKTGRVLWRQDYPTTGYSIYSSDVIYFATDLSRRDFQVAAFDTGRGDELWRRGFPASGSEYLALHGNILYVLNNVSISALTADTGDLIWKQKLDDASHLNVLGDKAYAMEDFHGVIQSLDISTGRLSGALRVSAPTLVYVYHDNLVSTDRLLLSAQGNTLSAYSR